MVFVKAPAEGRVKTRLAAGVGEQAATFLHRCFVEDILATAGNAGCPVHVHFTPPESRVELRRWLGADTEIFSQVGADLGERMAGAFAGAFSKEYERAILIGTDFPDLPSSILTDAFSALADHDAVLGPARDGGYYLIGFSLNGFLPEAFRDITWGARDVCQKTVKALRLKKKRVYLLPAWWDIDTYADLLCLAGRLKHGKTVAPATFRRLRHLGFL
jgi:hypothetical protein